MIELDGAVWFPDNDPGVTDINDPFSNLIDEKKLPRLLRDYDTWCLDMRLCFLREGKAIGSSSARTGTRDSVFLSRLQSSPNYKKNLRTQKSQGTKQFQRLVKEAKKELHKSIRSYRDGSMPFAELRRHTANFFEHFYSRIWEAGRKASGVNLYVPEAKPTRKEIEWLKSAVREELGFWQSFLLEVEAGEVLYADQMTPSQLIMKPPRRRYTVDERLDMYLKGLDGIFDSGRVAGMPNNLLFYWHGPKPGERNICKGCLYIVERQPFTKANLPAVPRTAATPCGSRCRHKLVVRQGTPAQLTERMRVLPKKDTMVRQLASIQKSKKAHRVRGKLTNPWQA